MRALRFLKQVEKYDVFLAEQPIPRWDIDGLARLRRKTSVPIFADEAAAELNDLVKLAQRDAVDGFFLKVPKAGGIHKSKKYVAVAEAMGLKVMTGCMINSGLGAAVEAHFLCSTEWLGNIEQESIGPLNMHDLMETDGGPIPNDLGLSSPRYEKGCLYPPEGNGLGVELNEDIIPELMSEGKAPIAVEL